jgi:hypothetical protein
VIGCPVGGMSPNLTVSEEAEDMGLGRVEVVEMDLDPSVRGIIELCDPRAELSSESQFPLILDESEERN